MICYELKVALLLFNLLNAVMPHWHVLLDGSIDVLCCVSVKLNAVMPHRHVLLDCSSVLIMVWQCVPLTPGGLFHTATEAIYLTALVVSVLTVICDYLTGR